MFEALLPTCGVMMVGGEGYVSYLCWLLGPSVGQKRSHLSPSSNADGKPVRGVRFCFDPEYFEYIRIQDIRVLKQMLLFKL